MRVLLRGYYGYGNFGDDVLLKLVHDEVQKCHSVSAIGILGSDQKLSYLNRTFPGAKVIRPREYSRGAGLSYDRVIDGGGGALFEYRPRLRLKSRIRKRAAEFLAYDIPHLRGTRFCALGIGIGPFGSLSAARRTLRHLRLYDFVSTRDEVSAAWAAPYAHNRVHLSADLLFALASSCRTIKRRGDSDHKTVLMIVRRFEYGGIGRSYLQAMLGFADHVLRSGWRVVWHSYQGEYDTELIDYLNCQGITVSAWDPWQFSVQTELGRLASADCIITCRMHGLLLAGLLGTPAIGIAVHDKLVHTAEQLSTGQLTLAPTALTTAALVSAFESVLASERPSPQEYPQERRVAGDFDHLRSWLESSAMYTST